MKQTQTQQPTPAKPRALAALTTAIASLKRKASVRHTNIVVGIPHTWFAWYPVYVVSGDTVTRVWLKQVNRQFVVNRITQLFGWRYAHLQTHSGGTIT